MVREALPDGGKVAIFIGRLEQDNARRRRQGTIDAMLGRSHDPSRFDPPGQEINEGGFQIVGTYTDQLDFALFKAQLSKNVQNQSPTCALKLCAFPSIFESKVASVVSTETQPQNRYGGPTKMKLVGG